MLLCVNIFTLSLLMTRVEKYRRYREEIANMKVENFSSKSEAAKQVDKITSLTGDNKIGFEDVMGIREIYAENDEITKKTHRFHLREDQIIYLLVCFLIGAILLVSLIVTGINVWGK